jgi:hypothetical protein
MPEDLRDQAERQDKPLPQTPPDGRPRPLDKAPPEPPSSNPPSEGGPASRPGG